MFWKYSPQESKLLLVATLMLFSAFSLVIGSSWRTYVVSDVYMTANSVGVYAGVEGNEFNTLAQALDEREQELDRREQALINSSANATTPIDEITLLLVTIAGFGLFGLILLNFYLDSKRRVSIVA